MWVRAMQVGVSGAVLVASAAMTPGTVGAAAPEESGVVHRAELPGAAVVIAEMDLDGAERTVLSLFNFEPEELCGSGEPTNPADVMEVHTAGDSHHQHVKDDGVTVLLFDVTGAVPQSHPELVEQVCVDGLAPFASGLGSVHLIRNITERGDRMAFQFQSHGWVEDEDTRWDFTAQTKGTGSLGEPPVVQHSRISLRPSGR